MENVMEARTYKTALIVGAGEGLSASLARLFTREGIRVALAARQTDKLGSLCKETVPQPTHVMRPIRMM
jgi:NADP-dependent 3-hydroxy acid dehydrogenase YdfG